MIKKNVSAFLLISIVVLINFLRFSSSCDIVGASACPHKPDNDLKEENFEEYCAKYKQNLECVYGKYKGCDRKEKYVEAMESMIKGLRKKAKSIEALCEIDIDIPVDAPKPKNTSQDVRHNGHSTTKSINGNFGGGSGGAAAGGQQCKINSIQSECNKILNNFHFNPLWNGMLKQKWCLSASAFFNCIQKNKKNCYGIQYQESLSYIEKLEKFIHSQSNINCPGGLEGCSVNINDVRCKMGVKYGESNNAKRIVSLNSILKFISIIISIKFAIVTLNI